MPKQVSMQCVSAQPNETDKTTDALLEVVSDAAAAGLIAPAEVDRISALYALGQIAPDALPDALNRALAKGGAAQRAIGFLEGLFSPSDVIEARAICPAGGGAVSCCARLDDPAQRNALVGFINARNGLWNLYVGLSPRRDDLAGTTQAATNADVTARQVVALDFDFKGAPDVDPDWSRTLDTLKALGPVAMVDTGNGAHVHFLIDRIDGEDAASAVTGQIDEAMGALGADRTADLPRVMRLPWTVNMPNASKRKRGCMPVLARPVTVEGLTPQRHPVADLCNALKDVAARLGLPGRGEAGKAPSAAASHYGATGERKTPRPAPSAEALRVSAEELPNHPGGPFDAREEWAAVGHAFKGAAREGGFEAEGRDVFVDWSGRWGGDSGEAEQLYDTCNDPHTGWGALMQLLEQHGTPAGVARVRQAVARAAFPTVLTDEEKACVVSLDRWRAKCAGNIDHSPSEGMIGAEKLTQRLKALAAPDRQWVDETQLEPRQWLMGYSLIRDFVTMLAAPGGVGKSTFAMVMALSLASGRALLAGQEPRFKQGVGTWVHSGEDGLVEQQRRKAAAMKHCRLSRADVGDRLLLTSARDVPLCLARMGANGPEIVQESVDAIVQTIKNMNISVFIADPVVNMSTVPENDNTAVNVLMDAFREIADRTGAAVMFTHHTSKQGSLNMQSYGVTSARGADAFQAASRAALQLERMTSQEAAKYGVSEDERTGYFRLVNGKASMAVMQAGQWFRNVSVKLNNGTSDYPAGDRVAVVEDWTPPGPVVGTASELHRVQTAIQNAADKPRENYRAANWVGWLIADVLGVDAGRGKKKADRTPEQARNYQVVSDMLAGWLEDGGLKIMPGHDSAAGRATEFVVVGEPALIREHGNGADADMTGAA